MPLGFPKPIAVHPSVEWTYFDQRVRCTKGLRKDREGVVRSVAHWEGGGGIHVHVEFPNGAMHWHHVDTVELVRVKPV